MNQQQPVLNRRHTSGMRGGRRRSPVILIFVIVVPITMVLLQITALIMYMSSPSINESYNNEAYRSTSRGFVGSLPRELDRSIPNEPDRSIPNEPDGALTDEEHDKLPILLIGGSDGSGTRSFVNTIKELGVFIVADDKQTFDVHAAEMFQKKGWPAFVNAVLKHTHSGNYEWDDLPIDTKDVLEAEVKHFIKGINFKYNLVVKRRTKDLKKGSQLPPIAEGVSFAIKAPVSMLVLPVLTHFFGKIKFLHVLRDGRDIALSSNQSPVLKFYDTTYLDSEERNKQFSGPLKHVRGMQLWNDWNLQVHEWATQHPELVDYMSMRSEDLLETTTRYECWQALANFVGARMEASKICCKSGEAVKDHGKSVTHNEEKNNYGFGQHRRVSLNLTLDEPLHLGKQIIDQKRRELPPQIENLRKAVPQAMAALKNHLGGDGKNSLDGDVKTRYGKWQAILANQTELSMYLHQEGAQGLEQFGYEPRKEISYMKNQTSVCDESVECPRSKTSNRNNVPISSVELGRSNLIDQQMYQIRKLERSSKVIEV